MVAHRLGLPHRRQICSGSNPGAPTRLCRRDRWSDGQHREISPGGTRLIPSHRSGGQIANLSTRIDLPRRGSRSEYDRLSATAPPVCLAGGTKSWMQPGHSDRTARASVDRDPGHSICAPLEKRPGSASDAFSCSRVPASVSVRPLVPRLLTSLRRHASIAQQRPGRPRLLRRVQ